MIQDNRNHTHSYKSSSSLDVLTQFPKSSAHSLEPVDYMMDSRTGAMLAFDSIPSFRELHNSTTSYII
jgi:hypothetical protein